MTRRNKYQCSIVAELLTLVGPGELTPADLYVYPSGCSITLSPGSVTLIAFPLTLVNGEA